MKMNLKISTITVYWEWSLSLMISAVGENGGKISSDRVEDVVNIHIFLYCRGIAL